MCVRVSLRGMLRLIRVDTKRRVHKVGFLAGRLIYMHYGSSSGISVGKDASRQSRGCEFKPQLGRSFRRLTKVTVTSVIRLPPLGLQSMCKSSQLLGKKVVWSTGLNKPGIARVFELAAVILRINY